MREFNYLQFPNDDNELVQANLIPRSPTVIRKGDLVKFDFEHAQCQRGMHSASEALAEDKETLNLSRNRKKRYRR